MVARTLTSCRVQGLVQSKTQSSSSSTKHAELAASRLPASAAMPGSQVAAVQFNMAGEPRPNLMHSTAMTAVQLASLTLADMHTPLSLAELTLM